MPKYDPAHQCSNWQNKIRGTLFTYKKSPSLFIPCCTAGKYDKISEKFVEVLSTPASPSPQIRALLHTQYMFYLNYKILYLLKFQIEHVVKTAKREISLDSKYIEFNIIKLVKELFLLLHWFLQTCVYEQ